MARSLMWQMLPTRNYTTAACRKYAKRLKPTTCYYAKKNKAGKPSQDCEQLRERYMKVMREDFPKDFISDDEWDYIEAMASWPKK